MVLSEARKDIKELMLQAIEEKRPEAISSCCLHVWNQPFFYKIDKAKVLTVSYNPTDRGAITNYPYLVQQYINQGLSSETIFETLYNFKKEYQWRKFYDLIFGYMGFDVDNDIAHMDVSFFPYKHLIYCLQFSPIDNTKQYLLKTIDLLDTQLKFIFVDGAKNRSIINILSADFELHKRLSARKNKNPKVYDLLIYRHRTKDLYLVYYGCQLYGSTCPSEECVKYIAKLIDENTANTRDSL